MKMQFHVRLDQENLMSILHKLFVGLLLVAVMTSPLMVMAQDEDDEMMEVDTSDWVEFESEDGIYKLLYPPDWFVEATEDGGLVIANSESLLETFESEEPAESGEKVIAVFALLPADLLALMGIQLEDDADAKDLITAMAELMTGEDAEDDDTELGETDVLVLSDESEIGVIEVSSEENQFEGYFLAYESAEGILALGLVAAHTGEFDEEFVALATAVLENIEINITVEELMETMSG